ncbi:hypothetical protein [Mucisphaera sp.]|uniref:hypothetical protein n=1 Tax=Mucisphaera sp. TaxID=2913024 RepID=UPI003D0C73D5
MTPTSQTPTGPMTSERVEERVRLGARLLKAAQERLEAREELHKHNASSIDHLRQRLQKAEQTITELEKSLTHEKQRRMTDNDAFKQALGILTEQLAASERTTQQLARRLDLQDRHTAELSSAIIKLESRPAPIDQLSLTPPTAQSIEAWQPKTQAEPPTAFEETTVEQVTPKHPLADATSQPQPTPTETTRKPPVYGRLLAQLREQTTSTPTDVNQPSAA